MTLTNFYRFSNLKLSSYSFVIIFFVLFCYTFFQPLTVKIVLNEDFVEEDHVDETGSDKNPKENIAENGKQIHNLKVIL